MTFRTRLVLATTVAVVVAVLVASTASFLAARNSLLGAADNSLTAAAKKITAGQQISATTATLGQVIDSAGAVVSGGDLPVTPQVRLVAAGLAPSFFTTVDVGGDQLREYVEPLPAGTARRNARSWTRAEPCRSPPCSTSGPCWTAWGSSWARWR